MTLKDIAFRNLRRRKSKAAFVLVGLMIGVSAVVAFMSLVETLDHFRKASYILSAVVALVGGLVVLVTMMGSVRERTAEIGIFRAIGYRRSHVMQIILLEAAVVSALAGVLGYLVGLGATKLALPFFTTSHSVAVPIDPVLAGAAFALALVLGLAASLYPALLASRLDPNEALRAL